MTQTISNGVDSFSPLRITGYEATSETENVYHSPSWVTLGDEGLRAGRLPLLFNSLEAAMEARTICATKSVLTLEDTELPELDMTFIRDGAMTVSIDREHRKYWRLELGFKEVTA